MQFAINICNVVSKAPDKSLFILYWIEDFLVRIPISKPFFQQVKAALPLWVFSAGGLNYIC